MIGQVYEALIQQLHRCGFSLNPLLITEFIIAEKLDKEVHRR